MNVRNVEMSTKMLTLCIITIAVCIK